jgi:excisionase family DNA binding protein
MAATTARLLLTVEEAAQRLGIGCSLAWHLVRSGELPSVRLGRLVCVPEQTLQTWLDRCCPGLPRCRDRSLGRPGAGRYQPQRQLPLQAVFLRDAGDIEGARPEPVPRLRVAGERDVPCNHDRLHPAYPALCAGSIRRDPRGAAGGDLPDLTVHSCGADTGARARFAHPLPSGTADAPVARGARMAASLRRGIWDLSLLPQRRRSSGRTTTYGAPLPTSLA